MTRNTLPVLLRLAQRGGPVFDNIVLLFRSVPNRGWTPASVQEELKKRGVDADAKAIANVLGYLAKNGKLLRVARGQYLSQGWMLVTSEEIPGAEFGQNRLNEHEP